MRKLFPLLVIVIIATIAAAACNDGAMPSDEVAATQEPTAVSTEGTPATAQNGVSATPVLTPTPAPTVAQAPAAKAQEAVPPAERPTGGTFRRLWADPPTLDPHLTSDTTSAFLVVEIFSGLVTLSTDLQLVHDIAERWNISNDGLVYTFFLRPEAKFHDGKRVTAHDFKWSMERASSPDTASPVADTYLNDIVGAEDVFEGRVTEISGHNGHRRSHPSDNYRRAQGLLPGQDDLPHRIRPGPGERRVRRQELVRQSQRHRPLQAHGVQDRRAYGPSAQ